MSEEAKRVLVIDDEGPKYKELSQALTAAGYVHTRADGIGDLEDIRKSRPDAIIIVHHHAQHTAGTYWQSLNSQGVMNGNRPKIMVINTDIRIESSPEISNIYDSDVTAEQLINDLDTYFQGRGLA